MSVLGRLWRRAPAWRVTLISAVALTGLAAMFPPALPTIHWPGRGPAGTGPLPARYHPLPDPAPSPIGHEQINGPKSVRSGLIAFGGRQIALPAGDWHEIAMSWQPAAPSAEVFDRVVNNHLTGLILAVSPGPMNGAAGPVDLPPQCAAPSSLAHHISTAPPGLSPLVHECWSIIPADMRDVAGDPKGSLLGKTLLALGDMQVEVPKKMLFIAFYRSDDRGWLDMMIMVPDNGGPTTAIQAWVSRYAILFHKGYDHDLVPTDLTPATIHDPS